MDEFFNRKKEEVMENKDIFLIMTLFFSVSFWKGLVGWLVGW